MLLFNKEVIFGPIKPFDENKLAIVSIDKMPNKLENKTLPKTPKISFQNEKFKDV